MRSHGAASNTAAPPRLEISVLVAPRPVDLTSGDVDLALRMGRGPWPGADGEPLLDEVLYPVTSPACALVRRFADLHVALGAAYWLGVPPYGRGRTATAAVAAWLRHEARAAGPAR